MKEFMGKDFLLTSETSKILYHEMAENLPIIDYHCHVNPEEIFLNKKFENITQIWLGGDHYKWRVMRSNGVEERYCTGDATDREKFQKFAEALPKAIGNPMFHWCHLELREYFGYEGILNGDTAEEVWNLCNEKLQNDPTLTVRGILKKSNVKMVGTTDDPCDSLIWHEKIKADKTIDVLVCPSFRPDPALNIEKPTWTEYIAKLSKAANIEINSLESLENALKQRMDHFKATGCKAADHGLDFLTFDRTTSENVESIVAKALRGETLSDLEISQFKTHMMIFCGRNYAAMGWAQQWHYNCQRNPNSRMLAYFGPDSGCDTMNDKRCGVAVTSLLDALDSTDELPKTILYSLNPNDNEMLASIIGAFQGSNIAGKIQHGSGWWYNDTKTGMIAQMISLANHGLLGNFVGMLTDSRSFLSYTRHAYFRRIMCELIGTWVENGEYPQDRKMLKAIVEGISFYNAKNYFALDI